MPSNSTVKIFYERGHSVAKLTTPNVLAFVREYFQCDTLNGAELEDQESTCFGNFWEERIFESEIMRSALSFRNHLSALTLVFSMYHLPRFIQFLGLF